MLMVISGHVRGVPSVSVIGGRMMLYGVARDLALILLGLTALVMPEIVEDACRVTIGVQDT